jgi:hypothetical protein
MNWRVGNDAHLVLSPTSARAEFHARLMDGRAQVKDRGVFSGGGRSTTEPRKERGSLQVLGPHLVVAPPSSRLFGNTNRKRECGCAVLLTRCNRPCHQASGSAARRGRGYESAEKHLFAWAEWRRCRHGTGHKTARTVSGGFSAGALCGAPLGQKASA